MTGESEVKLTAASLVAAERARIGHLVEITIGREAAMIDTGKGRACLREWT